MSLSFEDLSLYDLNLIKSNAVYLLVNTKISSRYEALTDCVFSCIYAKGFKFEPYPSNLFSTVAKEISNTNGFSSDNVSADGVIEKIFSQLNIQNVVILKDETRISTWSNPKPSWYTAYDTRKKPWVF